MANEPKTLQQAISYFSDPDNCLNYLIARRWKDATVCPTCGSREVSFVPSRRVWQCKTRHPKCQFSIKVGTIFEDSPIGLDKWLTAMWMVANCKNGGSSWEMHRTLGVTQKSTWFMLQRIRLAMQGKNSGKLGGPGSEIEVDETFIGGKSRNMHHSKRARVITGTGGKDKAMVMGVLERGGQVRAMVVENRRRTELQKQVREHVEAGAAIFTDELPSYEGLSTEYDHAVIDHAVEYVNGNIHTNGMENFWSLLKRGLHGTYVSVEPFHLFRYIDEQAFRYNNRGKVLHDEDLAAAILDRILERGRFIHLDGPSGRTRHLNLEEVLPAAAERARISGIRVPEFPEPTALVQDCRWLVTES